MEEREGTRERRMRKRVGVWERMEGRGRKEGIGAGGEACRLPSPHSNCWFIVLSRDGAIHP